MHSLKIPSATAKFIPLIAFIVLVFAALVIKPEFTDHKILFFTAILLTAATLIYLAFHSRAGSIFWERCMDREQVRNERILAGCILLIGFLLRLWNIWEAQGGFMWDSAYKGLDAIAIREFGDRPIFLDWNAGREALIAYLVAASQLVFGTSVAAVRIVVALAGCFTLVFFYLFVHLISGPKLALLSTFLLSISKWHIIHSRYALRIPLFPMFELAALYFVALAFRTGKQRWLMIAGALGGLGFHSYIAYRIFPLILFAFILNSPWCKKLKEYWKGIAAGAVLALLFAAPLIFFAIQNYERFSDRIKRTAVWSAAGIKESPGAVILKSIASTVGIFTYRGDSILRHNVNSEPMLSPWIHAFFLLGLAITLANFRQPFAIFWYIFLLLSLIPGFVTVHAPHSARTLSAVVPAVFFAAIGITALLEMLSEVPAVFRTLSLAVILGACLYTGMNDALIRYTQILETASSRDASSWGNNRDEYDVAILLNQLGPRCEAFLSPQLFFHATEEYLTYKKSSHELFSNLKILEKPSYRRKVRLVFLMKEELNAWWLRDEEGKDFFKWWQQVHGMDPKQIRKIVFRTYKKSTRTDDLSLLEMLRQHYPRGKILDLGRFIVFMIK